MLQHECTLDETSGSSCARLCGLGLGLARGADRFQAPLEGLQSDKQQEGEEEVSTSI